MPARRRRGAPIGPGGFSWNRKLGRYIDARGRIVSDDRVRLALDAAIRSEGSRVRALGRSYAAGEISATAFFRDMRATIRRVHLWGAASAKGGWAQLTRADRDRVRAMVKSELEYLNRFARDVRAGRAPLGRIAQRAELYVKAAQVSHDVARTDMERRRGMTEERNILHRAEHCEGENSCINESARGWVAIGTLKPIGTRKCGRNCKCSKRYRK